MAHPINSQLGQLFANQTRGHRFGELACFRALMDAILNANNGANATEYHGRRSWVFFPGDHRWTDVPDERCELSDLCLVWYRTTPRIEGRVTFLQAKFSHDAHDPCTTWNTLIDEEFKASTWQWYLLNNRPLIRGANVNFTPPTGLLANALLPSVASFGIFHYPMAGDPASFFYGAADVVQCLSSVMGGARRHQLATEAEKRVVAGYDEQVWCCCLETFGDALFSGRVGTPFRKRGQASAARIDETWNNDFLLHLSGDIITRLAPEDPNWSKFSAAFQVSAPTEGPIDFRPLARQIILIDGDGFKR